MDDPKLSQVPASPLAAALPYLAPIRRRPRLLLACALVALACAGLWMLVREPDYEATAAVVLSPIPSDDNSYREIPELLRQGFGDPARPVATMALLLDRDTRIAADAAPGLGISPEQVEAAVEVDYDRETNLIEVVARDADPERAAKIANDYVAAALRIRSGAIQPAVTREIRQTQAAIAALPRKRGVAYEGLVNKLNNLSQLSTKEDPTLFLGPEARPPESPAGPPRLALLGAAGLAGIMFGAFAAVAVALSERRRIVDGEAAVREVTGAAILGSIPELATGGPGEVAEAYGHLRSRLAFRAGGDREHPEVPGPVVLVTSAGPGSGRSAVASGLARAVARAGAGAWVIDLDPRSRPGRGDGPGLGALASGVPLEQASVALDREGLVRRLAWGDGGPGRMRRMRVGRAAVAAATAQADCVIIDGPAGDDPAELAELARLADQVLIAVRPGRSSRVELSELVGMLATIGVAAAGIVIVAAPRASGGRSGFRRSDHAAATRSG